MHVKYLKTATLLRVKITTIQRFNLFTIIRSHQFLEHENGNPTHRLCDVN